MTLDTTVNGLAALSGTLLPLTTATLALRFFARHKQKSAIQLDDWMVFAAWIFFTGLTAISFYGISQKFMGYSEPKDTKLVNEMHPEVEKVYLSLDALSIIALGLAKLSALLFYRRLFWCGIRDVFSVVSAIAIAVVAAWTTAFFIMTFLLCGSNINFLFIPGNSAKCTLIYPYFEATTISDFLLDIFIIALPIPKIWSLNLTIRRRFAVLGVFLLALVGLASSTARMAITLHLVTRGRAVNDEDGYLEMSFSTESNTSWAYFIILEVGLTIIAVNMPSLWYFVTGVSPERVLRSVRSMISIRSDRGSQGSLKGSHTSERHSKNRGGESKGAGSSGSDLANPYRTSGDNYVMKDLDIRPSIQKAKEGIHVERTFQSTGEQV